MVSGNTNSTSSHHTVADYFPIIAQHRMAFIPQLKPQQQKMLQALLGLLLFSKKEKKKKHTSTICELIYSLAFTNPCI